MINLSVGNIYEDNRYCGVTKRIPIVVDSRPIVLRIRSFEFLVGAQGICRSYRAHENDTNTGRAAQLGSGWDLRGSIAFVAPGYCGLLSMSLPLALALPAGGNPIM